VKWGLRWALIVRIINPLQGNDHGLFPISQINDQQLMGTDYIDSIYNQVDLLAIAGLTFQAATNNGFIPPVDIDCIVNQVKLCIWAETEQPGFAGDLP
jgi:hypothetical protein